MQDEHLDPETLARLLSEENLEDRNRLLLHLLSRCPHCYEVGGYLLDLYRGGALPLAFGITDVAMARTRSEAPRLLEEIGNVPFERQLGLLQSEPRFLSWGLCELLSRESERVAAGDSARAVELAEIAVLISRGLREDNPAEAEWLYQLRAHAWAFLGNALRVAGNLKAAEDAIQKSDEWWRAGEASLGDVLGYEPMILELKASLRTAQRRFPEALELLDRLAAIYIEEESAHRDLHSAGRVIVMKSFAHGEMGEPDRAIELLREAGRMVAPGRDPRLVLCVRHNLAWNLTAVGRYDEARDLLPDVRTLAESLGRPLDLVRLRWADGRVAAGLGRRDEARTALEEVRREFGARGMGYDAALVTLELAVLLAEEGRAAEVRELAAEMVPIFQSQEVHREALAALAVFQRAATAEALSADLARDIVAYLERARHDPGLRFEQG